MGGTGSGNHGGGPCVEDCRWIDIGELIRAGVLRPREQHTAMWGWKDRSGRPTDMLVINSVETRSDRVAELQFAHFSTIRGVSEAQAYEVRLVAIPQRFGGIRWMFLCPMTGRRCLKLFLPLGGRRYLSRQAYRLAYRSQRQSPKDRACARYHKMVERHGHGGEKPLRMRWATWDWKLDRVAKAEMATCRFMMATVARLQARAGAGG